VLEDEVMEASGLPFADAAEPTCIVLRANASLSTRAAFCLFLALAAMSALIGAAFLFTGAWPVVPFLGLELIVVGATLCVVCRRARDAELLVIDEALLHVIQRRGRQERRHAFQRYWARAVLEPVRDGYYPSRLVIRSHGRELEIGACLSEERRVALARQLQAALGPRAIDSPPN
jgi:uncharacterized membrane protein